MAYRHEPLTGLSYLEAGPADGPLVLLLHGFPDVAESWEPVMARLAEAGLRAVAPVMPGYHPSPAPPSYDIDTLTEILNAFARALQPEPALWVGHDWGAVITHNGAAHGMPAAAVTISVPHLLTFFAYTVTHPRQLRRSAYQAFFQLPFLPERAIRRGLVTELWRHWSPDFDVPPDHLRRVEDTLRRSLPGPLAYYRSPVRNPWPILARARALAPSSVPMRYLHGRGDGCIVPGAAEGQERWYLGPFTSAILDGGHFLPNECPGPVAEAIVDWAGIYTPTSGS